MARKTKKVSSSLKSKNVNLKVSKVKKGKKVVAKKVKSSANFSFATNFFKSRLNASKVYLLLRAAALASNAVLSNKPALRKVDKKTQAALEIVSNLARKEEKDFVKSLPKRLRGVTKRGRKSTK